MRFKKFPVFRNRPFLKLVIQINIPILFLFILDRIFKILAISSLSDENFPVRFFLFKNPGIAFSIPLQGSLFYFFLIAILGIAVFKLFDAYRRKKIIDIASFTLILFGAFSNLLDRFKGGLIIDYFFWPLVSMAFNLADLMVLSGAILILWMMFKKGNRV